nr:SdrD B-like domain-containing protein [Stenotrophomonas mori]
MTLRAAIGYANALPDLETPITSLGATEAFYGGDTNTNNNTFIQDTTLQAASDLALSKQATPDPVIGGGEVTYTVTVRNNGPSAASGFTVTDDLPSGVVLVAGSQSGAGWTFDGANGTYAGQLANGGSVSYSFRAKVNVGSGTVTNAAHVAGGVTPDPRPDNNTGTVDTQVTAGADMSLSKKANPAPASAGQEMTFTLTPRNLGPSAAAGIVVVDDLPEGFEVQGTPTAPAGWSCEVTTPTPGRQRVRCTRSGELDAGAQEDITVRALVPSTGPNSEGSVTNTAQVSTTTPDANPDNNSGQATFTVLPDGADLEMAKRKLPELVPIYNGSGDRSDSMLTSEMKVTNLGPRAVTGQLQVVDTLALGEQWVDAAGLPIAPGTSVSVGGGNNTWSCSVDRAWDGHTAQKVTCTLTAAYPVAVGSSRSLTLNTLALAAGDALTNRACTGGSGGSLEPQTGGSINSDPISGNDCADGTARATALRADLKIGKTATTPDGGKVLTADEDYVEYTLVIGNDGDATAGVVVDDLIPNFINNTTTVTHITGLPIGWTHSGATGSNSTLTLRSNDQVLAKNATVTVSFRVNRGMTDSVGRAAGTCGTAAMPAGSWCNTAGIAIDPSRQGAIGESNYHNNSASDWVQVHPVADMATTAKKITSGNPGRAGVETTYVIDYRNMGASGVTGVVFRDTFTLPANDAGFVLISAVRTGGGSTACTVQTPLASGITATPAPSGMSYANTGASDAALVLLCPRLESMPRNNAQSVTIKIRPNVNSGNTGREFRNTADFYFDVNGDGVPDSATSGTLPSGETYDYNTNTTNDSKEATLRFDSGKVELIINKYDQGFTGGIDPLGYDARPGNEAQNRLFYQINVRNSGPSLATGTVITDTLTPPRPDVKVTFVGTRTGTQTAMTGPLVLAEDPASPCAVSAGSSNPTIGAPQELTCTMPGVGTSPLREGVIAVGSTSYLYLVYEYGNSPEAGGDTLANEVTVGSNESNTGNNHASESTTIRLRADLEMTKTAVLDQPQLDPTQPLPASAPVVNLLQPFWYVLEVYNHGPGHSLSRLRSGDGPARGNGVVVTDTLPEGLEVLGGAGAIQWQKHGTTSDAEVVTTGNGNCSLSSDNTIDCRMGDLALGGRTRILVPVRWTTWPGAGDVRNTAHTDSDQHDPNPGNNDDPYDIKVKKSSLAGVVFEDRDRAGTHGGIQQAGEPGISGIKLRLSGTDAYGNPLGGSTGYVEATTGADGSYVFDHLPPADTAGYTLTQIQPTTYVNGPVNPPTSGAEAPSAGGDFATVNPVKTADSVYTGIVLPADTAAVRYNFPEVRRPALSGYVYVDSNYNDVRDAGDGAIADAVIELLDAATGNVVTTTKTNSSGFYTFNDLDPLTTYTLREVLPGNGEYRNRPSAVNVGSNGGGTAEAEDATTDLITGISLASGEDGSDYNFGEDAVAGITGTVYLDRNNNGSFDAGDAAGQDGLNSQPNGGLMGVAITLEGAGPDGIFGTADDPEPVTVQTDSNGQYRFEELSVGQKYRVTETQPDGYADAAENSSNVIDIAALPAAGSNNNNFGEKLGSLSGSVYEDFSANTATNDNGQRDSGEQGIANVTLTLTGTDVTGKGVTRTAITDSDGNYRFADLLEGTYTITETQPAYLDGKHVAGNADVPGDASVSNVISDIGLTAGQDASGYLFGELKSAPISGIVYVDHDDNGRYDPGIDVPVPGVTIVIEEETSPGVWTTVHTQETGSDGSYLYADAVIGHNYRITETQPAGLGQGQENGLASATPDVVTITGLPVGGSPDNNFGELGGTLSGNVWLDVNNDGVRNAGEPPIAGVTVILSGIDANNATVNLTTVTDIDGSYRFDNLVSGTYTVTQEATQPVVTVDGASVTTLNGVTLAGTIDGASSGTATAVATTPSAVSGIVLGAGKHSRGNDFGEILPVSLSGSVFLDLDNDGVQSGAGEVGLKDVTITLTGVDDLGPITPVTLTTDADGRFSFDGLRPGIYTVTEPDQPAGTANGITTAGTIGGQSSGTASAVTTLPSTITGIDLSVPGATSVDNLFAEIPRSSAITGKVWLDRNNDGVVDPGETGIGGVTVELEGVADDGTPITLTTTTEPDGTYSFTELPPGTYTVTEPDQPSGTLDGTTVAGSTGGTPSQPNDGPSKITGIKVGVDQTSTGNNFGEIPPGGIGGFVYNDSNDDGIKQAGEGGYAGVTVVLSGTDDLGNPVNVTMTTDVDGSYQFDNLRPGTYTVTEPTQPPETLNGITTAGTIDGNSVGVATDRDTVPSAISGIVLPVGASSIDNNFGEIGDSPDMLVGKSSTTPKFTVNNVAVYTITVRNGGQKASSGEYLVSDRLPAGLTLADTPSGDGWTCTGARGDSRFQCRSSEVLNAGATSPSTITVRADVAESAARAGTVNNAVLVEGGGENEFRTPTPAERAAFEGEVTDLPVCDPAITQNACRVPNEVQLAASVGGTVWFDIGSEDSLLDGGDERLQDWTVELVDPDSGAVVKTAATAADGSYRFADLVPGVKWNIQFRDPSSGVVWAWPVNRETAAGTGVACDVDAALANGGASACRVSDGGNSQLQVVLKPGEHLPQQSLPVDPSGVVYDATTRDPVPGSIVTLQPVGACNGYDPLTAILNAGAGGYTVEGNAVSMTVGTRGYYQFVFGPGAPARCEFRLTVAPPGGYRFVSTLIVPEDGSLSPAGAAGTTHTVQPQATAPTGAVGSDTQYWLTLYAGSATAGIVHNHIPLDTAEATGLVITKTGDRRIAEIGDTVQYTITVRQTAGSPLQTVNIVDTLPRGFTYIDGTARVDGRALDEPLGRPGPRLGFTLGSIDVGGQRVLTYRVRVGVGAMQGDGVNRAQAHGCSIDGGCIEPVSLTPVPGSVPSNRAEYRVRVTGGVFTEEACVLGKVFVDCNNNHVQDEEELGIPGVRLYFSDGTWLISDSEGKYSYCGLPPQSHTLKVDPSTLPLGARLTTSSNRNLGDADSLFLDLKNGELHRADFIEGSCSNPVLEQVKARRTQGEVRAPENESGQSPLRFESKPVRAPQQATDSANQRPIVEPRPNPPSASAPQEVQP